MKNVLSRQWVLPAFLLFFLAAGLRLGAQQGTSTLTGRVVDDQGGAIPGALVTITEQATSAVRTAQSDPEGAFRVAGLAPGRYNVDISLSGFATLKVTDVSLAPTEVKSLEKLQ